MKHALAWVLGAGLCALAHAQRAAPAADAAAWWQQARQTVQGHVGSAPNDYCDVDSNWIFIALAQLNAAVAADPAIRGEIQRDRSAVAAFRRTPEFKLWWTAIEPVPTSAAALRRFLVEHPTWTRPGDADPRRHTLVLHADGVAAFSDGGQAARRGTWRIDADGRVIVARRGEERGYALTRSPFAIQRGALHFDRLQLGDEWTLGGVVHDCDF